MDGAPPATPGIDPTAELHLQIHLAVSRHLLMLHCHNGHQIGGAGMISSLNYLADTRYPGSQRKGELPTMFWYDRDMSGWGYAGMAIGMILF